MVSAFSQNASVSSGSPKICIWALPIMLPMAWAAWMRTSRSESRGSRDRSPTGARGGDDACMGDNIPRALRSPHREDADLALRPDKEARSREERERHGRCFDEVQETA